MLIIENDKEFLEELSDQLSQADHDVSCGEDAEEGLSQLAARDFDVVLVDNGLPRMNGLEFLRELKDRRSQVRVILMTGVYNSDTVIQAPALGAAWYVTKPGDEADLVRELAPHLVKAIEVPPPSPSTPPPSGEEDCLIVDPRSEAMQGVLLRIGKLAALDESVLILGETGTGKGAVARKLHQFSRRAKAPFLQVDCTILKADRLESELFGHEKSAFPGADKQHKGMFEQCAGGTLFLDEIGEISRTAQSQLLGVLQDHRFRRMTGKETSRRWACSNAGSTNTRAGKRRSRDWSAAGAPRLRKIIVQLLPARHHARSHAAIMWQPMRSEFGPTRRPVVPLLQNSQQFGKQPFITPESIQPEFGNECDRNYARHGYLPERHAAAQGWRSAPP
jgi:CheY-like chemotaxis protein